MRQRAPVRPPVALTIAGSDSGGGAGIQADLQTMAAHDAFGTSVLTAVTAQNTRGVQRSDVLPVEQVEAQYDAVVEDFDVAAAKTGMLATAPIVEAVTERVAAADVPAVVDPVMVAASGDRLLEPEAEAAYEELVAEARVVTPNADEAAVLTGVEPTDVESARKAGERLRELGADAALVKGGHVAGDPVVDVLVTAGGTRRLEHPRVDTDATHGSGCALSAAIAAHLAGGADVEPAVERATGFLASAVRYGYDVGRGPGAVNHLVDVRDRASRDPTAEAVHDVVASLLEADARPLVPEVGTNVVGATPHAETVGDVAAVDGRITRTKRGIQPGRGVRFGASSRLARFLLAAREFDPELRFALDCRFDERVGTALDGLGWSVAEFERSDRPGDGTRGVERPAPGATADESATDRTTADEPATGRTSADGPAAGRTSADGPAAGRPPTDWDARRAFERAEGTPVAVVDRGAPGNEPLCRLVATDASTLVERATALLAALGDGDH